MAKLQVVASATIEARHNKTAQPSLTRRESVAGSDAGIEMPA